VKLICSTVPVADKDRVRCARLAVLYGIDVWKNKNPRSLAARGRIVRMMMFSTCFAGPAKEKIQPVRFCALSPLRHTVHVSRETSVSAQPYREDVPRRRIRSIRTAPAALRQSTPHMRGSVASAALARNHA
jgi:hypothetical protein